MIARAKGEYIVHFDDDDYYSPQYITHMITTLEEGDVDICKLSSFFLLYKKSGSLAYWDLLIKTGIHFEWNRECLQPIVMTQQNNRNLLQMHFGYGFSLVYKRSVWEGSKFQHIDKREDSMFVLDAVKNAKVLGLLPDVDGLCLHILHDNNTSQCFPQFVLPSFFVASMFSRATPYLECAR